MYQNINYSKQVNFYDICTANFTEDLPIYLSHCPPCSHVLEIGCGTGRVLKPFLEKGYRVTGVDIVPEMLAVAAGKFRKYLDNQRLTLLNHEFCEKPLPDQYQYVLVTFYTFNYLLEDDQQYHFLKHLFESMLENGRLIMHLFYPRPFLQPGSESQWQERHFTDGQRNFLLRDRKSMIGNIEKREQIFIEGNQKEKIISYRRFIAKEEIDLLLKKVGFNNIQIVHEQLKGGHSFNSPSEVLRKAGFMMLCEKN